ncbi:MAG: carboxypeptidase-like regulatory domain-containing protein [Candidatus Sericytochromatia bacterium]|nr:carboxypeptidase-like regulatory domain-containing protein [Candidatus Sericytochromatia bacterium]
MTRWLHATLPALLAGCFTSTTVISPRPTAAPPVTTVPTAAPPGGSGSPPASQDRCAADGGCVSPANLIGGTLRILVRDTRDAALPGATVVAMGSGLGFGVADASGDRSFTDMNAGTYSVRASAPGYLTHQATVSLAAVSQPVGGISQVSIPVVQLTFRLLPSPRTIEGTLRDQAGQPVQGARVVAGLQETESDADGRYRLEVGPDTGSASIHHVGHEEIDTTGGVAVLADRPVGLAMTGWPFGMSDSAIYGRLQAALSERQIALSGPAVPTPKLGQVLWLAAPTNLPDQEATAIRQHLELGGTVLVSADWGGASGFDSTRLQDLLRTVGAYARVDIVRTASGQASLLPLWQSPLDGTALGVQGSCTVEAAPPARTLAVMPETAYRVASGTTNANKLAVSRQVGRGRLVVVGDTQMLWPSSAEAARQAAAWLRLMIDRLG